VLTKLTSAEEEIEEKEESGVWSYDVHHEERNGGESDGGWFSCPPVFDRKWADPVKAPVVVVKKIYCRSGSERRVLGE
jgi:hypothetical protein